jgi:hypothetical protein
MIRVGIAISTLGERDVQSVLDSLAQGTRLPAEVVIANQGTRDLAHLESNQPMQVTVIASSGGLSRGRNDAIGQLSLSCDLIGFPNDDTKFSEDALEKVQLSYPRYGYPGAIAVALVEQGQERFALPADGSLLNRKTVWRAIEPATFISVEALLSAGGFDTSLGAGAKSPWQSGEGTDLLLRMGELGFATVAMPSVKLYGPGERRNLSASAYLLKTRKYARGTGYVYKKHRYKRLQKARLLMGPIARLFRYERTIEGLRLASARVWGRLEGLGLVQLIEEPKADRSRSKKSNASQRKLEDGTS